MREMWAKADLEIQRTSALFASSAARKKRTLLCDDAQSAQTSQRAQESSAQHERIDLLISRRRSRKGRRLRTRPLSASAAACAFRKGCLIQGVASEARRKRVYPSRRRATASTRPSHPGSQNTLARARSGGFAECFRSAALPVAPCTVTTLPSASSIDNSARSCSPGHSRYSEEARTVR